MRTPESPTCVLCGLRPATTRDHVPPKGIFKGLGVPLITVPACNECNNGASQDDEDMRFFISMQVGKQTPGSAKLWDLGARKSLQRRGSLQRQVVSTARDILIQDASGAVVNRLAIEVPASVYEAVFGRTTRGLYFFHTGRILDPKARTQARPLLSSPEAEYFVGFGRNEVGGVACRYWYQVAEDDPNASLWLYCFYDLHWIHVDTGAACDEPDA